MQCVWLTAEQRTHHRLMPTAWEEEINHLHPPVDNQLHGTSSWRNLITGRDRQHPAGWDGHNTDMDLPPACSLVEIDPPYRGEVSP
jgi:hypothetical protein